MSNIDIYKTLQIYKYIYNIYIYTYLYTLYITQVHTRVLLSKEGDTGRMPHRMFFFLLYNEVSDKLEIGK